MPRGPCLSLLLLVSGILPLLAGCQFILPEVSHQPVVHNPFPQLSRVAIAPFFNQSDEPTVDGRLFAMAYFAELQAVPGYEIVPVGVVEEAIIDNQVDLSTPGEARRLANLLGVDAVVIGSVTDFSPYYPPRCGLRIEWYAANPGFHSIPAGYGLPWGTPQEEYIPESLVFEAEMELARAQMATQTPNCPPVESVESPLQGPNIIAPPQTPPQVPAEPLPAPSDVPTDPAEDVNANQTGSELKMRTGVEHAAHESAPCTNGTSGAFDTSGATGPMPPPMALPPEWPDARGFIPPGPSPVRPPCVAQQGPVMTHTRIYQGNDTDFTTALSSYVSFRDETRFGGWKTYLERSEEFIRFCCHLHISEMLTARGGGGETRVVKRWSDNR
jgi:hypothetical protein